MNAIYPIIANSNFATRDDEIGQAAHAARLAVENGQTGDADLIDALDTLETALTEVDGQMDVQSGETTDAAERAVADAWTPAIREGAQAERESRYID